MCAATIDHSHVYASGDLRSTVLPTVRREELACAGAKQQRASDNRKGAKLSPFMAPLKIPRCQRHRATSFLAKSSRISFAHTL